MHVVQCEDLKKTDCRGKIIEKLLKNDNIVLLNDTIDNPTHNNIA